jgi:hypothetical protein
MGKIYVLSLVLVYRYHEFAYLAKETADFCRLINFPCSTARREGFDSQSGGRSQIVDVVGERSSLVNCDFRIRFESDVIIQRCKRMVHVGYMSRTCAEARRTIKKACTGLGARVKRMP